MPLIRIEKLSRHYRKGPAVIKAVDGVSLRIDEGEFAAIMGPSGAGKSTLLYMIGCLDRPSGGRYFLDGNEVSQLSDRELSLIRATQIGFVFQTFNLLHQLNVLENVMVSFLYSGRSEREARSRALKAIEQVGLEERISHHPQELSGGEMQRAAIARALCVEPRILLADEPTGNLDTRTGKEILDIFSGLNRAGMTILMVTHNADIAGFARRRVYLQDGRLKRGGR